MRLFTCRQQDQQAPRAFGNRFGGGVRFSGNFGNIAADLPRTTGVLAFKRPEPRRILKCAGSRLRLAQSLQAQAAHSFVGVNCKHEFDCAVRALDPPSDDVARGIFVLINSVNVQRVFVARRCATEAFSQFHTQTAQDTSFDFVACGVWKKQFQIGFWFTPRTEGSGLGRLVL